MDSQTLRQKFLDFFETKGHKVLPSASLTPAETDPSVLFTTAGMQQFKRYYTEPKIAPSARIATIQKCVRTGDIDEVGDDTHLTLFEMVGNFSFGYKTRTSADGGTRNNAEKNAPYFKKEAIAWAWEFLTSPPAGGLQFDKKRIHATYFRGEKGVAEDTESLKILQSIDGLCKIESQGFDDNFWSLGTENSPGGPTVEFYIDGVEVWNLVFNEYVMKGGKFEPSEVKGVDTGMGFERLLCVINNAGNVYQTDLFELPLKALHKLSQRKGPTTDRIILDHIKAAVFAINDGIVPSNKDAGYVVRRLIRRAIVKARELGIENNFITKIAEEVFYTYKGVYEFKTVEVSSELEKEEIKFRKTLREGLKQFELMRMVKERTDSSTTALARFNGKELFDLYQTYGFPLELSLELATGMGLPVEKDEIDLFRYLSKQHQEKSRTASAGLFKGGLVESGEMTTKYHTATHLLLAALRQLVSADIYQRGSNITAERLRLDFNYDQKLTLGQLKSLEDLVNEKIAADLPVEMNEMSIEEAKKSGAMGIFDSKYGDKVKVYSIGNFSKEICGGPHVTHTGGLGHFKIIKEESSSSGVRRLKAVLE